MNVASNRTLPKQSLEDQLTADNQAWEKVKTPWSQFSSSVAAEMAESVKSLRRAGLGRCSRQ